MKVGVPMSIREKYRSTVNSVLPWGVIRTSVVVAAVVAALAAIIVSPLVFGGLAQQTEGWTDLANIGQAYGGIAAVLSGLALGGIVISLLLQWRQSYADRILAIRQHHLELVKLGLMEPMLLGRTTAHHSDRETALLHIHANVWVAHWATLWDLRHCDESQLRQLVSQFFNAHSMAREWWQHHGRSWSTSSGHRRHRFQEIVTDEWRLAMLRHADTASGSPLRTESGPRKASRSINLLAFGFIAGGAVTAVIWAWRKAVRR